jgi:hypothetical protein
MRSLDRINAPSQLNLVLDRKGFEAFYGEDRLRAPKPLRVSVSRFQGQPDIPPPPLPVPP